MEISVKDYMMMQPNYPKVADSDKFYLQKSLILGKKFDESELFQNLSEDIRRNVVLAVVGYYQDIISDCGIWRSFITIHNSFYGSPLPFYTIDDDYCESELNVLDIRFIIWYVIECQAKEYGLLSPFDGDIATLAEIFFSELDADYLSAPNPTEYTMAMDVELNDISQAQSIFDLSTWLFWNSYFMRHAARGAMEEAMEEAKGIIAKHRDPKDAAPHLNDLNDRVMLSNPTGPLALTVGEWLKMIIDGEMPDTNETQSPKPHKFYTQFRNATNGKDIAFFSSYDALESFLSDDMGWGECAEGHLPNLRNFDNFTVLCNHDNGILIAKNIAQFIAHPNNPCYDQAQAQNEGYKILTNRGACPIDLIKYIFTNNLAPDIHLPYSSDTDIIRNNWDFLARLYQQRFYRPD